MSRLERGLMTVDLRDALVPDLLDELKEQLPVSWKKPGVELRWRVAPGVPPLRTDPGKLLIILRNLVHNALKFTGQGMVTVSASATEDRKRVTFVVQDTGVGIRAEHLSGIFEIFRQIPQEESIPGGVGLGLYIVNRLAGILGAEVDVSSNPGRGSTFRVHLPVAGPLARLH
jgi:signal transduction histidine kinase